MLIKGGEKEAPPPDPIRLKREKAQEEKKRRWDWGGKNGGKVE